MGSRNKGEKKVSNGLVPLLDTIIREDGLVGFWLGLAIRIRALGAKNAGQMMSKTDC